MSPRRTPIERVGARSFPFCVLSPTFGTRRLTNERLPPVLVRIVRMTFRPDTVDTFLEQFDASAPKIRAFPGCHHLELWRDADAPAVCTTYSHWESEAALNQYRESDLFRSTWRTVKPLFGDRPEAHSYSVLRSADAISKSQLSDGPAGS